MSKEGPKSESEAERLDRLIVVEESKLRQLGFDPNGYQMPQLHYQCRIVALERALIAAGVIEQEPTQQIFREVALEQLTEMRKSVEEHIEQQKAESRRIMLPDRSNTILGPNGRPLL